jgi:hypothetical protein
MTGEQALALDAARRWCEERAAVVRWDEGESRCQIRVAAPSGAGSIEGEGAGFYEAYVECRVRYDAAAPGGPPSHF